MDRQKLFEEKTKKQSNRKLLLLTCNRALPNVKRAIVNNWNLLHINQEFQDVFQELSFLPLRKNRNLYDLPGWKNFVDENLQRHSEKKNFGFSIVSQNRETYAVRKFSSCNILKPVWHKKHKDIYIKSRIYTIKIYKDIYNNWKNELFI